jgi:hypothetical protein
MRLPRDKIYRAFPELDQFTDAQCAEFVARAKALPEYINVAVWVMIAGAMVFLLCGCLGFSLVHAIRRMLVEFMGRGAADIVGDALVLIMLIPVPAIAGLMARDAALRRMLKRIIWRQIERIRCPQCRYSLLGQNVTNDQVRCPECGDVTTLRELGLKSAEDLFPPTSGAPPIDD